MMNAIQDVFAVLFLVCVATGLVAGTTVGVYAIKLQIVKIRREIEKFETD